MFMIGNSKSGLNLIYGRMKFLTSGCTPHYLEQYILSYFAFFQHFWSRKMMPKPEFTKTEHPL